MVAERLSHGGDLEVGCLDDQGGRLPPQIFFFFFWRTFLGFFDLQLMEDIKDWKEEVLDEVVMEHIK